MSLDICMITFTPPILSSDSRLASIGQVDTRYILGKVLFVMMPGYDKVKDTRDFGRIGGVS